MHVLEKIHGNSILNNIFFFTSHSIFVCGQQPKDIVITSVVLVLQDTLLIYFCLNLAADLGPVLALFIMINHYPKKCNSPKLSPSRGAAIAQWIRLRLPSCRPMFESHTHCLRFFNLYCSNCIFVI